MRDCLNSSGISSKFRFINSQNIFNLIFTFCKDQKHFEKGSIFEGVEGAIDEQPLVAPRVTATPHTQWGGSYTLGTY
jgi:hypothetical protein